MSANVSQTLARGLQVLSCFVDQTTLSLSEISAATGISRQVAQRLVNTLLAEGYLTRDPGSKRLQPSIETIHLSSSARNAMVPRLHALPHMIDIARATQETVNLSVLDRRHWLALCVESVDGADKARYNMRLGTSGHLHVGASRKVILAWMTEEERSLALAHHGLPMVGPNAVVDIPALESELARIRADGWAVTFGESQPGATGCSVPVFAGGSGPIHGSLSVIGAHQRMTEDKRTAVLAQLQDAQAAIHRSLRTGSSDGAAATGGERSPLEVRSR